MSKAGIYTGLGIFGFVVTGFTAYFVGVSVGAKKINKNYQTALDNTVDKETKIKVSEEFIKITSEEADIAKRIKDGSFKEEAMTMAKSVLPIVAVGAASAYCVSKGEKINKEEIKKAKDNFNKYKDSAKQLFGEKGHKRIVDNINKVPCNRNVTITNDGFLTLQSLDFGVDEEETVHTFYDSYSNRYFESTISKVLQAQYHINRNWSLGMEPSINLYYSYLGLDPIDNDDDIYWDFDNCEGFIDFNNRKETLDDGMEILTIDIVTPPDKNDKED